MLILDLVDYISDKGTMPIWTEISTKAFLSAIIAVLKKTDNPDCHSKILFLIQKWAKKYQKYNELLPNFSELYSKLLKSKVEFSNDQLLTYQIYTEPMKFGQQKCDKSIKNDDENNDFSYTEILKIKLNSIKFDEKNAKLYNYLGTMVESVALGNEIIDNTPRGGEVESSLHDIFDFLPKANKCLIELITSDKLQDEQLTEFILGVIEDVNRTISRVEALQMKKKPEPFLSFFTENSIRKDDDLPHKKPIRNMPNVNRQSLLQSQIQIDSQINSANDLFAVQSNSAQVRPQIQIQPHIQNQPQLDNQPQMQPQFHASQQQQPQIINNQSNSIPDLFDIFATTEVVQKDPKLWEPTDILSDQLKSAYSNPPQQNYEMSLKAISNPQIRSLQVNSNSNMNIMPMNLQPNQLNQYGHQPMNQLQYPHSNNTHNQDQFINYPQSQPQMQYIKQQQNQPQPQMPIQASMRSQQVQQQQYLQQFQQQQQIDQIQPQPQQQNLQHQQQYNPFPQQMNQAQFQLNQNDQSLQQMNLKNNVMSQSQKPMPNQTLNLISNQPHPQIKQQNNILDFSDLKF